MILTEEEARTKWCPEVQFVDSSGYGIISNRDVGARNEYCIASNCMMWRWFDTSDPVKASTGYCGKAGKP